MYGRGEYDAMRYTVSKGIEIMTAMYVLVALLVASLSQYILLFLSNREYLPASYPLMIVLVIGSIFVSSNVLAVALQSVRKTKIFIISSSAALIPNFLLSFLLIPRMHLIGDATGFSSINIASITSSFILLYYAKKYSIFKYARLKIAKIYIPADTSCSYVHGNIHC